ncbi:MAG: glycosyl hydrolase [Kiritimatiellaeota bacterium]|nr:glycosyl hydrolase [Kiritimatiellota bacterium]
MNTSKILASMLCAGGVLAADTQPLTLAEGFAAPPAEAKPLVWWHWINGNITKDGIRADLEDMKRVGIGGAQMLDVSIYLPPGPVRYGTDAWHEHVQYAIRTAGELGLELDLMNSPGWSGSGGPWITPERGMKRYVWTETAVTGGAAVSAQLKRPTAKLDFYRDVAVLAIPAGSKATVKEEPMLKGVAAIKLDAKAAPIAADRVLVLTKSMNAEGLLTGELPAGQWTVLRFGYTTTGSMNHPAQPEGHGQECDKLDEEIVKFQFEQSLGRIIREAGPQAGKGLRGILFDSFEGGYQNWSASLPQDFQQRKGYDLVSWLPVLTGRTVGSAELSEAFLRDFRGVISELVAEKYFGTMQRLAHTHGLKVYAEAQGGPLDPFLCNEHTDVPMNEFWMPDACRRFGNMKQAASIAHLLGRRVVGAEAFTAKPEDGRWLATPATLKACGDGAFVAGINRFIFHTYVHQPYSNLAPGFTLGRYGTHFGRLNTWWPMADAWMSYLARCQFLLQQGHAAADVLLLTDAEAGSSSSDRKAFKIPSGYDFDLCYPRHLATLAWRDGAFHSLAGSSYRLLVLPQQWCADLATLQRLKTFLDQGATIVGEPPTAPAGLLEQRDQLTTWRALVAEVFTRIKPCESVQAALDAIKLAPDASFAAHGDEAEIYCIHRATDEGDLYFVANQSGKPVTAQATFRAGDRVPEIWDPVTGHRTMSAEFKTASGCVSLPLALDVAGSTFVVFRHPLTAAALVAMPAVKEQPAPIAIARAGGNQTRPTRLVDAEPERRREILLRHRYIHDNVHRACTGCIRAARVASWQGLRCGGSESEWS